jgi:hypothetical protein
MEATAYVVAVLLWLAGVTFIVFHKLRATP